MEYLYHKISVCHDARKSMDEWERRPAVAYLWT